MISQWGKVRIKKRKKIQLVKTSQLLGEKPVEEEIKTAKDNNEFGPGKSDMEEYNTKRKNQGLLTEKHLVEITYLLKQ